MKDNSSRKLVYSRNHYMSIEDYEGIDLPVFERKEKRSNKKNDYTKYHNRPLAKSIDRKANQKRMVSIEELVYDEDDFDDIEE